MARVLFLHGLGGTGATMWPLVGHLANVHHTAFAPVGGGGERESATTQVCVTSAPGAS